VTETWGFSNFDEFMQRVIEQFPEALVFEEEDGQICIGTGLYLDGNTGELLGMGKRSLAERNRHLENL